MTSIPKPNLYQKFGNPARLVEFRLFSFNDCSAGCKNCFYKKTENDFHDFRAAIRLADDLLMNDYSLETLYLLPTDVFENEFNYKIFSDPEFENLANRFSYIGLATALNKGFDQKFLDDFYIKWPGKKIEMHVNIQENRLKNRAYIDQLYNSIGAIKAHCGPSVLLNLALNVGTNVDEIAMRQIQKLVAELSDDRILEINFTFMFNDMVSSVDQKKMLLKSYPVLQKFSDLFAKNDVRHNQRTLLRKPAFVFKGERIYLTPIIPFDEYVFVADPSFQLKEATFDSFLECYGRLENLNTPILKKCHDCEMLPLCQGKSFFSLANTLSLGCIKESGDTQWQQ